MIARLLPFVLAALPATAIAQPVVSWQPGISTPSVPLEPTGQVVFGMDGVIRATCSPTAGAQCLPTGPVVTVALDRSPTGPVATSQPVTITPTVSGGSVCIRRIVQPSAPLPGWDGVAVLPPTFGAGQFTLPSGGTYRLGMTCYGNAPAGTSNVLEIEAIQSTVSCSGVGLPAGFLRDSFPTTWAQQFGNSPNGPRAFPSTPAGTASPLNYVFTGRSQVLALAFSVPANGASGTLSLNIPSEAGQVAAPSTGYHVTLRPCLGDVALGSSTPPITNPNRAWGCSNVRDANGDGTFEFANSIQWAVGVNSTASTCGLIQGQTYYLHLVLADVRDGIQSNEHTCPGNVSSCGVVIVSDQTD